MQEYVRSYLPEQLTAEVLARVAGISTSAAERQFRRHTGLSLQGWIRGERLRLAARLLRTSNRRIADVAAEVGFDDALYFSRVFRRHYGMPPSAYARRTPFR
jgi:transcriptional regulator GlxA family with amidase domain